MNCKFTRELIEPGRRRGTWCRRVALREHGSCNGRRHDRRFQTGQSTEFYRKLFGEPTPGQGNPPQPSFAVGDTRLLLYNPAATKPPKIDHFSVLVDNFDAAAALKVVQGLGADAKMSTQGTLNEFFDPDGIRLQVTFPGQTYGAPTPPANTKK